jgi:hypothetical protein
MLLLPLLPFKCAFDILIRHGGFAGFENAFGVRESFFRFYILFQDHGNWVDAICTCRLVQALSNPVDALFLLRPVDRFIRPSVRAWEIARERKYDSFDTEYLVAAMKIFLPVCDISCYPWLSVDDLRVTRSSTEWVKFAGKHSSNYHFTAHWWNFQPDVPLSLERECMGEVVEMLAREEPGLLLRRLKRDECNARLDEKKRRDAKREVGESKKKKQCVKKEATLTKSDMLKIEEEVEKKRLFLSKTLHSIRVLFVKLDSHLLISKFDVFAMHVAGIAKEHPYIKWGVRLSFHEASYKIDKTSWAVERAVWHHMYSKTKDSVDKLKKLAAVY